MSHAGPAQTQSAASHSTKTEKSPGLLFTALFPATLWGINNVAIAVASEGIPVATFNAARSALSVICLMALLRTQHVPFAWKTERTSVLRWLLIGGIGLGVFQLLLVLSIRYNGPAVMAVLATLSQLMALTYEKWVEKRPFTWREVTGSMVALFGVCTIFLPELTAVKAWNPVGLATGLAAPACWAAYSIGSRAMVRTTGPLLSTGLALSGASLVLIPVALWEWRTGAIPPIFHLSLGTWTAFGLTVVVGAVLSNVVWMRVLERVGSARALLATYLLPVMTTLFSLVLFGDVLDAYEASGSILVLLGVALVRPPKVKG